MARKMIFADTSKCTGCKACTVACKEWNDLPAEKTHLIESYQTMKDFTPKTWTYVTFIELYRNKTMDFFMRKAQCFHCGDPACLKACTSKAISKSADGLVVIDQDKCIGCGYCAENCPFGVPKVDAVRKKAYKCTGCVDRVENGLTPACVQTCQPGALQYGEREALLAKAKERLNEVRRRYPRARLYGEQEMGGTTYVYLLLDAPEVYHLPQHPAVPVSLTLWQDVIRPVGTVAVGGAAAAVVVGVLGNLLRGGYRREGGPPDGGERRSAKGGKK
ncbi:Formate dehydrogenase iron-sulphur subunit [Acididesulfobacillus acetoxydans]|uniref:Formate dehydrogenase iron-sulphur subunit n=1 Tax=Acididesulfobacillus acetoxydans TaxID=1561005 RepID=A0A8S0WGU1_9FIRM|nr:4Fe-4S dicluster domain-containing protein [Acididesulfobacillus acetoxydans]CAA7602192.1 Formate dehydrogenase iron-sulphur subunit [Acididesulfobacillus acetoxydans]CEJ08748.1 Formate dehydrogenase, nitrate-inducible, iron-sulfur subunit [Acididesulfobacillus acetoxydans]